MAKITKLDVKTFPGKDPSITVTLDNGVVGYLQKDSDPGLKEGESVEVSTTPYTSKAGKLSILVTLKRAGSSPLTPKPAFPVGGGISALDVFNAKLDMNKSIFEAVLQQLADGKFDDARASEKLEFYRNYFENVIDVLAQGK